MAHMAISLFCLSCLPGRTFSEMRPQDTYLDTLRGLGSEAEGMGPCRTSTEPQVMDLMAATEIASRDHQSVEKPRFTRAPEIGTMVRLHKG
ncbi:hypothetical protein QBC32DRAFT_354714 [Pseudoneurospora amorphoporcata]|uniref:Uncharacterized protein n=1 Tax=Pseudoneurospora amorphoporcata TaxID=241081 RepID=A0AAN6SBA5_9PEZI|nr:hypothetical protein QBC32DRAFT_354714 [Pseudoneurospora amorphoporcata]